MRIAQIKGVTDAAEYIVIVQKYFLVLLLLSILETSQLFLLYSIPDFKAFQYTLSREKVFGRETPNLPGAPQPQGGLICHRKSFLGSDYLLRAIFWQDVFIPLRSSTTIREEGIDFLANWVSVVTVSYRPEFVFSHHLAFGLTISLPFPCHRHSGFAHPPFSLRYHLYSK